MQQLLIERIDGAHAQMFFEQAETAGRKHSYLSGIFMQAEVVNGNGRVYNLTEMTNAVRSMNDRIKRGETVYGELNHPDNLSIDLNNVSHIITEMRMDGNNAIGKARIIENHPKGQIVKAILEAGGRLGVSSRGSGNVTEGRVSDFNLMTVDVVAQPSAQEAFPLHVMESLGSKKIMTLADAVIHDKAAQKYLQKEITAWLNSLK
jgi:hypothetical protein